MEKPTQLTFNTNTQLALNNRVESYLGDDVDEFNKYGDTIIEFNLKKIFKFDVGKNCDGFSPLNEEVMNITNLSEEAMKKLVENTIHK